MLAFLSFQVVLHHQEAPELFAIRCYLALPKHCQQIEQNLRENITTCISRLIQTLDCEPFVSWPLLAPWRSEQHWTERSPMSGNFKHYHWVVLMTVGGLKSRVSLWAFPLLCDKAVISIKCRTFYVPLKEAKRQRVNRGHGEDRGRESIKKCFLLHHFKNIWGLAFTVRSAVVYFPGCETTFIK